MSRTTDGRIVVTMKVLSACTIMPPPTTALRPALPPRTSPQPAAVHRSSVSAPGTLAMPGGMHSGVALAPLAAGNVCMATRMSAGLCLPGIST